MYNITHYSAAGSRKLPCIILSCTFTIRASVKSWHTNNVKYCQSTYAKNAHFMDIGSQGLYFLCLVLLYWRPKIYLSTTYHYQLSGFSSTSLILCCGENWFQKYLYVYGQPCYSSSVTAIAFSYSIKEFPLFENLQIIAGVRGS